LNLFKRFDNRFLLNAGERPPYPIILDNPTVSQVLRNFNKADYSILLFFTALGYIWLFIEI
jgi:hypothetical protein